MRDQTWVGGEEGESQYSGINESALLEKQK